MEDFPPSAGKNVDRWWFDPERRKATGTADFYVDKGKGARKKEKEMHVAVVHLKKKAGHTFRTQEERRAVRSSFALGRKLAGKSLSKKKELPSCIIGGKTWNLICINDLVGGKCGKGGHSLR